MELPPQVGAGPEATGNENNEEHEQLRLDRPRIYVASLSDYNAGILHGDWINATDEPDELQAVVNEMLRERYGRTAVRLCSEIVSVLLYLTSEEPDLTRTRLDRTITPASAVTAATVRMEIADVGFRLGAALRSTPPTPAAAHDPTNAPPTNPRRGVTPHPRRAHWHTYWTGPRDSDQRRLVLRWIHMIIVGADTTPITIRDVKP